MEQQSLPEDLKRIEELEFDLKLSEQKNEQLKKDIDRLEGENEDYEEEIADLNSKINQNADIEINSLMGGRILVNFEQNASNGMYTEIFEELKELFENPKVKELNILEQLKSLNNLTK